MSRRKPVRGQAHDIGRRKRLTAQQRHIRRVSTDRLAKDLVRRGLATPLILDRYPRTPVEGTP